MSNVALATSNHPVSRSLRVRCRSPAAWCGSSVPTKVLWRNLRSRAAPGEPSSGPNQPNSPNGGPVEVSIGNGVNSTGAQPDVLSTAVARGSGEAGGTEASASGRNSNDVNGTPLAERPRFANADVLDNWEHFVQDRREQEGLEDQDDSWMSLKDPLDDGSDDEDEYDDVESDYEEDAVAPTVEPVPAREGFTSPLEVCGPNLCQHVLCTANDEFSNLSYLPECRPFRILRSGAMYQSPGSHCESHT